jgi:hypothetical protein
MCFPAVAAAIPAAMSAIGSAAASAVSTLATAGTTAAGALAPYASGLQAAGTVASTVGGVAAAQAQAQQNKFNAKVAKVNANTALQEGRSQAEMIRERYRKAKGQAVADAAASGIDPSSGSAALLINDEMGRNQYLDEMTALWNKGTEATAHLNQAADLKAQAKATKRGGYLSAGSTLLTGMSRMGRIS